MASSSDVDIDAFVKVVTLSVWIFLSVAMALLNPDIPVHTHICDVPKYYLE